MMMIRKAATVGTVLLAWGCSSATDCTPQKRTWEIEFGSPVQRVQEQQVADAKAQGFVCDTEMIRNAFGRSIGIKYTCTRCD